MEVLEIIKYSKANFEKNKLTIDDSITIEEWRELGQSLRQVEGSVQWWIGDWTKFGERKGFYIDSKVYDQLEEITGLDRKTLQNYKHVAEKVPSSRRREDLSFSHHAEVAQLPQEKQVQYLSLASEAGLSKRELREEIKKESFQPAPPMPEGTYRVIYCDPPWKYNDECKDGAIQTGGASKHYPTMSIDELCEMELPQTEPNAVLFMWVTSPLLEESFRVVNAWGFKYKTSFVWDKVRHNMGHYNSVRHELLLVCTKGSCTPDNMKLFDSVQSVEKTDKHSEKPEEFRDIINTLYTTGNKIELFARVKTEGWEAFGNEL